MMEELSIANHHLKIARNRFNQDYEAQITKHDSKEKSLTERLNELYKKKLDPVQASLAMANDGIIEVNARGYIISAKRSTMTQLKGSQFEVLFGVHCDKKLQRDSNGHILMDVNTVCFPVMWIISMR